MVPEYYWVRVADSIYILSWGFLMYVIGYLTLKYIEGIYFAKKKKDE